MIRWLAVAPHSDSETVLPTSKWRLGIPGGALSEVAPNCSTGQIASSFIYATWCTTGLLPEGSKIDHAGYPWRDLDEYFTGRAIRPKGGALGRVLRREPSCSATPLSQAKA